MKNNRLTYHRVFDPPPVQSLAAIDPARPDAAAVAGDRRDGAVYVYTEEIILAVNVALATGRPLLLRGPSGSGKSSLAGCAARVLGRRYYEEVVTSRTQARDFLWTFDTLRRLNDATAKALRPPNEYVRPGPLWWAFDPETARWRGSPEAAGDMAPLEDPGVRGLGADSARNPNGAVVLIDEIDKADPDVPNNLLVPLGSLEFEMHEAGQESLRIQAKEAPLVLITTNDERELPNAFLRRCVILELDAPDTDRLVAIAEAHLKGGNPRFHRQIAELVGAAADEPGTDVERPSTAEYLDALRTCLELKITPNQKPAEWEAIRRVTLTKHRAASPTP